MTGRSQLLLALALSFVVFCGCTDKYSAIETRALRETGSGEWVDRAKGAGAMRITCCTFSPQDWTRKHFEERLANHQQYIEHLRRGALNAPSESLRSSFHRELEAVRVETHPFPFFASWKGWPYAIEWLTCTTDGKETRSVFVCRNSHHNRDVVFLVSTPGGDQYDGVGDRLRELAEAIDRADDTTFRELPAQRALLYDPETGHLRPAAIRDFLGPPMLPPQR